MGSGTFAQQLYKRAKQKGLDAELVQVADYQGDITNADERWKEIPKKYWKHYPNLCIMYNKIYKHLKKGKTLEECGIKCISMVQTWLRKSNPVKNAQFRVMSPHFHNRFYVNND